MTISNEDAKEGGERLDKLLPAKHLDSWGAHHKAVWLARIKELEEAILDLKQRYSNYKRGNKDG